MRRCSHLGCPKPPTHEELRTDVVIRQWCTSHIPAHAVDDVVRIVAGPPVTPAVDRSLHRRPEVPPMPSEMRQPETTTPEPPQARETPVVRPT